MLALLAVTCVGVAFAAAGLNLTAGAPKQRLAMPPLFAETDLPTAERLAAPELARADQMARRWLNQHPVRDDAAFESFALATVGPPPGAAVQARELATLHRLGDHRTARGITAARWLEVHGKRDVWKTYAKQFGQFAPAAAGARAKALSKDAYRLSVAIVTAGKTHFARRSPYQADPTLAGVNQRRYAGTIRTSYPAKHAVIGAAESTILTRLEPQRGAEFRWMADEVAYSRLYAAGHYPSDVAAGDYIGRLIANYELAVGPPTTGA